MLVCFSLLRLYAKIKENTDWGGVTARGETEILLQPPSMVPQSCYWPSSFHPTVLASSVPLCSLHFSASSMVSKWVRGWNGIILWISWFCWYLSFCWLSFCFGKSKPDYFRSCNILLLYFCNPCDLLVLTRFGPDFHHLWENPSSSNLGNSTLKRCHIFTAV